MPPFKEILKEIYSTFKTRNQRRLRKLNDRILKSAVIEFSKPYYFLAVICYVLSKIISKPRYLDKEAEEYMKNIEDTLANIAKNANKYQESDWIEAFERLEKRIKELEAGDPRFIIDLMTKGKLKVAATLYAQGLSLGLASEMTGMNEQDILDYAGKTMMFDRIKDEQGIMERIKNARRIIGK